ncbi:hypothetical protein Glove_364g31 [Diversispora epigaea]|uniref:Trafficking protein particle complex II-specific subunit 65 IgD3 domain-containing protein n=1 Tax=Diversispora epigaea TaxID=1348612 RepID=A0A397H8M4_9GLOM|nr:hypothetical protein Glove_364g31 [Diversispora epigaea]
MKPRETIFTESTLDILVPSGIINCTEEEVENIITAKPRTQAFYDELLYFYLHIGLPEDSGINDKEIATTFFQQFEIFVEASIIDASTLSTPTPAPPAVYRLPPSRSHGSSAATSPSSPNTPLPPPMDKRPTKQLEGTVIYSYLYNPNSNDRQMAVTKRNGSWLCIFPLAIPVAYVKTRAQTPALALSTAITQIQSEINQREDGKSLSPTPSSELDAYSVENFGMMNLLEGLSVDPSFESSSSSLMLPTSRIFNSEQKRLLISSSIANNPPLIRKFRKILSIRSALNVRMRTTSVSPLDHVLMMSVELENNTDAGNSFSVEAVKVEIAHGFVTRFDWEPTNKDKFPLTLNPVDQATFLYSITILDDPTFPKVVPQFSHNTHSSNSRPSSRRTSVSSIFSITSYNTPFTEERQRHVSIVAKGSPIINGVKNRSIESRWNCMLDLSNLRRREDSFPFPIPNNHNNHNNSIGNNNNHYNNHQRKNSKNGQQSQSSSRNTTAIFTPTGSITPTANRGFYSAADINPRFGGNKRPTILDHDSMGNGILSGGRAPRPMEMEVGDGVVVSFLVSSKVIVGKHFTIHVYFVNRSKHARRFTVVVPNKKRPNDRAIKNIPIPPVAIKLQNTELVINGNQSNQLEPFTEEADFIKKYFENETPDADIVCLENNVRIGPLHPATCESVPLHFLAIKEGMHVIDLVQLVDNDTGFTTNLRNVLEIYVSKSSSNVGGKIMKEKRIEQEVTKISTKEIKSNGNNLEAQVPG